MHPRQMFSAERSELVNYYDILEVNVNSSNEVIRASYRALAMKYHPDMNGNSANKSYYEEKMKQINMAYSVLADEQKRAEYDRIIKASKSNSYSNDHEDELRRQKEAEIRRKKADDEKKREADARRRENQKYQNISIQLSDEIYRLIYINTNTKKPTYLVQTVLMIMVVFMLISATPTDNFAKSDDAISISNEDIQTRPLPPTGIYSDTYMDRVAPFEVITSQDGNHYFIKLEDYYTDRTVMTFFIREGGSIDTTVPLGTYTIKYAIGKDWYGEEKLYGADTKYYKTDEVFEFTESYDGISGWTIELISQTGGNLSTDRINENDW